ncbi:uncharacterized protein ACHE_40404A [Aspergillus chevalieri]|uniref:BTB domain transcription factor n=1 Tax=Aspergillus chevalieri TaxID=182096 RepID=A0A7R7VNC2_ASPCH|nr:uncharacterized protein ACHE_40404A [Aspergillus chevalieri]BCR87840.1 hypothetical protein ACHE_40404A [Aspergillus chevalieri]
MAATRTSSRQAAQKAKEAITGTAEPKSQGTTGTKRKGATEKAPESKKGKKGDKEPKKGPGENKEEVDQKAKEEEPPKPSHNEERVKEEEKEAKEEAKEEKKDEGEPSKAGAEAEGKSAEDEKPSDRIEAGVRKSQEREEIVPSNILEKGIIYFFYRPRVNVEEPHSMKEVARSFVVLRPTPIGATIDGKQGSLEPGASCRLIVLPKKKFPTSARERDMAFVEKGGQSMRELKESFISGGKYETSTRGERTVEEARPYAEGVYAITSTKRASHLAYIITIPDELGSVQEDFGLRGRGSWIVQAKNPKFPGPASAQLPKKPEYPEEIHEKFADYRWVPLEPVFINYPNAQFLMIGEAQDELGKAAIAEPGGKKENQEQPGEELEKLEHENEERIEALQGDATVYQDLGLDAKNYPQVPTTWDDHS